MGRLRPDFLERVETFGDRVLDVTLALEKIRISRRILDQISACCTSVGANTFEADEAMSRKDFCKCLGIALKELNETRYWLRLITRRKWVRATRLGNLLAETDELRRILGAIISNTKDSDEED